MNDDSLPRESEDIAKLPKPVVKKNTAKDYFIAGGQVLGLVLLLGFIFNGVKNTEIGNRLGKVNTEIWLALASGSVGAYWKYYTDKEKDRAAITTANAITNARAIKKLDIKNDSLLSQLQDFRNQLKNNEDAIADMSDKLDQLIRDTNNYKHHLAEQRNQYIIAFFDEISQIKQHISYTKGFNEAMQKIVEESAKELGRDDIAS